MRRSVYYEVLLEGRRYRVRGMRNVALMLGIDEHRVARCLKSGRSGLYLRYPKGIASFGIAKTDDGSPYGSAVQAFCREDGFPPESFPSKVAAAERFGVTVQCVYAHIKRGTPVRDQFGYLWDLKAPAPMGPSPFAKKGESR